MTSGAVTILNDSYKVGNTNFVRVSTSLARAVPLLGLLESFQWKLRSVSHSEAIELVELVRTETDALLTVLRR